MEREPTLYVTLAESRDELEIVAESHEFDIAKVEIFEVKPPELDQTGSDQYTVFHPSEVELVDVMQNILSKMEKTKAGRIVFDSMSEIRMLARDPLRYTGGKFSHSSSSLWEGSVRCCCWTIARATGTTPNCKAYATAQYGWKHYRVSTARNAAKFRC
jgi:hypothetical protein